MGYGTRIFLTALLVGAATGLFGCAPRPPLDYSIPQHGTRSVVDPHGEWGTLVDLQDARVIEALNRFFAEHGRDLGLPHGLAVRRHPNGKSLLYEWLAEDGRWESCQQSARSSFLFASVALNGTAFKAQERDWGFVVGYRDFEGNPWDVKAVVILHEFYHQTQQIHHHGTFRYWYCYTTQFFTRGYRNIDGERETRNLDRCLRAFLKTEYGISRPASRRRCPRCGLALPVCPEPGDDVPE